MVEFFFPVAAVGEDPMTDGGKQNFPYESGLEQSYRRFR